jgi:hypothetical protein
VATSARPSYPAEGRVDPNQIPRPQFSAPPGLDRAVDLYLTALYPDLGFAAALDQVRELQKLIKPDRFGVDWDGA